MRIPFRKTSFAEDVLWASDALRAGYSIVYQPKARVKHYHFENIDYTFRRTFTVSYHYFKYFDIKPRLKPNGIREFLKNLVLLMKEQGIPWRSKLDWLWFNYLQRAAINRAVHLFHDTLSKGVDHPQISFLETS